MHAYVYVYTYTYAYACEKTSQENQVESLVVSIFTLAFKTSLLRALHHLL